LGGREREAVVAKEVAGSDMGLWAAGGGGGGGVDIGGQIDVGALEELVKASGSNALFASISPKIDLRRLGVIEREREEAGGIERARRKAGSGGGGGGELTGTGGVKAGIGGGGDTIEELDLEIERLELELAAMMREGALFLTSPLYADFLQ
jgi:hypothetical protein